MSPPPGPLKVPVLGSVTEAFPCSVCTPSVVPAVSCCKCLSTTIKLIATAQTSFLNSRLICVSAYYSTSPRGCLMDISNSTCPKLSPWSFLHKPLAPRVFPYSVNGNNILPLLIAKICGTILDSTHLLQPPQPISKSYRLYLQHQSRSHPLLTPSPLPSTPGPASTISALEDSRSLLPGLPASVPYCLPSALNTAARGSL